LERARAERLLSNFRRLTTSGATTAQ